MNSQPEYDNRDDSDNQNNVLPNFTQELKLLMTGYGDVDNPSTESAELLEEYLIEYLQNLCLLAYKRSKRKNFNEIQLKDLLYIIKNDKKKYYRIPLLLSFYENIKKTKK